MRERGVPRWRQRQILMYTLWWKCFYMMLLLLIWIGCDVVTYRLNLENQWQQNTLWCTIDDEKYYGAFLTRTYLLHTTNNASRKRTQWQLSLKIAFNKRNSLSYVWGTNANRLPSELLRQIWKQNKIHMVRLRICKSDEEACWQPVLDLGRIRNASFPFSRVKERVLNGILVAEILFLR